MSQRTAKTVVRGILHRLFVTAGALGMTLLFFLVLPLMQAISKPPEANMLVRDLDTGKIPPPPPAPEEEPEDEPEPEEEPPPELEDDQQPLDLSQLELALNEGFGDGWMGGDFALDFEGFGAGGEDDVESLFTEAELDQTPRAIYQPSPILNAKLRKRAPGTVNIIFTVDPKGRVENPMVQSSSDPVFDRAALSAVKQWRFEPGKRKGEPVRFRMRVPIVFRK